jgi:hypothetical protein
MQIFVKTLTVSIAVVISPEVSGQAGWFSKSRVFLACAAAVAAWHVQRCLMLIEVDALLNQKLFK